MSHPKHEIYRVHSADTEETAYGTDENGIIMLVSELKKRRAERDAKRELRLIVNLRDKYISIKETSKKVVQLRKEWYELAMDCEYSSMGSNNQIIWCHKETIHHHCNCDTCTLMR